MKLGRTEEVPFAENSVTMDEPGPDENAFLNSIDGSDRLPEKPTVPPGTREPDQVVQNVLFWLDLDTIQEFVFRIELMILADLVQMLTWNEAAWEHGLGPRAASPRDI